MGLPGGLPEHPHDMAPGFPQTRDPREHVGSLSVTHGVSEPDTLKSPVSYHYKDQSCLVGERILNSRRRGSLGAIWETDHQAFAPCPTPLPFTSTLG